MNAPIVIKTPFSQTLKSFSARALSSDAQKAVATMITSIVMQSARLITTAHLNVD